MNSFFVDSETDGLYGPFLSVAALVIDDLGNELDHFYGAIQPEARAIQDDWAKENVAPFLSNADVCYPSEEALLDAFWSFWTKWRGEAECIADVPYPVESRLFSRCVERDLERNSALGPFPLYDLSTLLRFRGLDPLADRRVLSGLQLAPHDAMNDVRMSAELWKRLMRE